MRKNVMKLTAGVLSTAVLAGMFATGIPTKIAAATEQTVYTKDVGQENAEDGREAASTVSSEIETKDENTEKDSSGTKNEEMGQNTVETTSTGTEEVSTQETMSNEAVEYYTIEEGDTLMSISLKMYKSPNYVDALMNANGIKEGDTIYPGEKIAIPSVN